MRHLPIPPSLFINNRKRLATSMLPGSIAILNSNDILPTNADGHMAFRQNSDLFYLTGIDQEETMLLLFPDSPEPKYREVLFLRETSETILIWEGYKFTKQQAREISGIETVVWLGEFEFIFVRCMAEAQNIYLNSNEHIRATIELESRDARFVKMVQARYPLHNYQRLAPILARLRMIKSEEEIDVLKEACRITETAFRKLLKTLKPGQMEYEAEAEYTYEFIRNRSRGHAYTPIFASGANSCVLHYISNNQVCNSGDIILVDAGAEYANYNADLTRVLPVNGTFTPRQKQVYNAVLRVHKKAVARLHPGYSFAEYVKNVATDTENELIGLGLLDAEAVKNQNPEAPLYKKYFMHGVSHYLGLDVHDVGTFYTHFQAGMVLTVEPGIYIREEGIGIRIENNILITENGPEDLMASIPIEADEIERLMAEK
jgi:Xaa-Pro aminopeptidase